MVVDVSEVDTGREAKAFRKSALGNLPTPEVRA